MQAWSRFQSLSRLQILSAACTILGIWLVTIPPSLLAQADVSELVRRVRPAVVTILTYDASGNRLAQGSGFFIGESGELVTNWHVIAGASVAEARTAAGQSYSIEALLAGDEARDIAILSTTGPALPGRSLSLAEGTPDPGDPVVIIGSPLGLEATVSSGIVSAVRDIPQRGTIIQITASISPGSSGSPVLNMDGMVIGIATMQLIEGQNLNFAVPSRYFSGLTREAPAPLASMSRTEPSAPTPAAVGLVGSRLRVTSLTLAGGQLVGLLVASHSDALVLDAPTFPAPTRVRLSDIQRIELSQGLSTNANRGAVIGAAAGAALGIILGFAGGGDDTEGTDGSRCVSGCTSAAGYAVIGGLLGGGAGGLIGFRLGRNSSVEHWVTVPLARLRGR